MNYRLLGKSDLQVSTIGFGCMSLGENDNNNASLLHAAIDKGVNFFDTADMYQQGQNEITVGKALKEKRKNVIIASKVGNQLRKDGNGWDWNPKKEYILESVNKSLARLQTDYIDLYQLHGGTIGDPIHETIDAFETLKKEGKIRHYGISSIRPNVIRTYAYRSGICSVMMQYSLLDRRPEESCLDFLMDKNISVLVRGSLASGLLVNKPAKPFLDYNEAMVRKAANAVHAISNYQRGNTQTAIQYVLNHPAIASVIVGIRTMEQLTEAVKTINTNPLSVEEVNALQHSIPLNYYKEHR